MKLFFFIFLLNVICGFAFFLKDHQNVSDEFELHLATKTPYRLVANTDASEINIEGCGPQKIWMLVRHGTRNPSDEFINTMKDRLPEIRDLILKNNPEPTEHLSSSVLVALQKWETKLEEADEKNLVPEGEKEMFELAERMQIRFPSLFPSTYSNTTYFFKYTASQRTEASSKYFTGGLFGMQAVDDVWYPEILEKDPILEFYKLCTKYNDDIKNNPETYKESDKFENSTDMMKAIESVNKALNFEEENNLSLDDVNAMYMTCAYETAWNETIKSPWCSTLTLEAVKAMEFAEDLKYYYRDGYGYELTYKQACQAFNDMIKFFESNIQNPRATIYFTHSGTLQKMLAHLGLYKDDKHLAHDDFENNDNKWRTSKIDAFGTNLAFVLYKCKERQKVVVLHQEHIVQLPDCDDACDFEDIKQYYSESINNCAFDEMCNNTKVNFM